MNIGTNPLHFSSLADMRRLMYEKIRPELEAVLVESPQGKLTGLQILRAVAQYIEEMQSASCKLNAFLQNAAHPDEHEQVRQALEKLKTLRVLDCSKDSYYADTLSVNAFGKAALKASQDKKHSPL